MSRTNPKENKKLRQKMDECAMSSEDLAKAVGVSRMTITNMLAGKKSLMKNKRKVCAIFGCMPLQVGLCAEPKEDEV